MVVFGSVVGGVPGGGFASATPPISAGTETYTRADGNLRDLSDSNGV